MWNREGWIGRLAALGLVLTSGAWAQTDNVVVVCQGTLCDNFPDMETRETLEDALVLVQTAPEFDTIWLPSENIDDVATHTISNLNWTGADGPLKIVGMGQRTKDGSIIVGAPENTIIQPTVPTDPVMTFTNVAASVSLEGITLTGGRNGIHCYDSSANILVKRCYIIANSEHGVLVEGTSQTRPAFVNCSISQNVGDGVHVTEPPTAAGAATDGVIVQNCSIVGNGGSGVFVEQNAAAQVVNTLCHGNAGAFGGSDLYEILTPAENKTFEPIPGDPPGNQWEVGPPSPAVVPPANGNADPGLDADGGTDPIAGVRLGGDYDLPLPLLFPFVSGGPFPLPTVDGGVVALTAGVPVSPDNLDYVMGDVNVMLTADHPVTEELVIRLTAPDGTVVRLAEQNGGNVPGGYIDMTFDDEAVEGVNTGVLPVGTPPFIGHWRPIDPLNVFDLRPATGIWTLEIEDLPGGGGAWIEEHFDIATFNPADWLPNAGWIVEEPMPGDGMYKHELGGDAFSIGPDGGHPWDNYTYQAALQLRPDVLGVASDRRAGFVFRYQGPADYYVLRFEDISSAAVGDLAESVSLGLYKSVGGLESSIGPVIATPAIPVMDWLALEPQITATIEVDADHIRIGSIMLTSALAPLNIDLLSIAGPIDVVDPDIPTGFAGLYAENIVAYFDDVRVDPIGVGNVGNIMDAQLVIEPLLYLTTEPMDFSGNTTVSIAWERWLNIGSTDTGAYATVEYSTDPAGLAWTPFWVNGNAAITDAAWQALTHDFTAVAAGATDFRVRWGYHAGMVPDPGGVPGNPPIPEPYSGWNLDNIRFQVDGTGAGLKADPGAFADAAFCFSHKNLPVNRDGFTDATFPVAGLDETDPANQAQLRPNPNPRHWWGEVESASLLHNKGTTSVPLPDEIKNDFENQSRDGQLDIGADEVNTGFAFRWYECHVYTANVPPNLLGRMGPGAVLLEVRVEGVDINNLDVCLLPQGIDTVDFDANPDVGIEFDATGGGGGLWYGVNRDAITTVLWSPDGRTDPHAGAVIADGHGMVHVYSEDLSMWLSPEDQAVEGRHVLIDTIPPRLDVPDVTLGGVAGLSALVFVAGCNDGFTTANVVGVSPFHPYPAPVPAVLPGGGQYPAAANAWPIDDGAIAFVGDRAGQGGEGAGVYFEVASMANGYAPDSLDLFIRAPFVDPPVMDRDGAELLSDPDLTEPALEERQVSGFDPIAGVGPGAPGDVVFNPLLPARWVDPLPSSSDGLPAVDIEAIFAPSGGGNMGIMDLLSGATTALGDRGENLMDAEWRFGQTLLPPGIPMAVAADGSYHLAVQFAATDRAGNMTEMPVEPWGSFVLDPVHFWWLTDLQVDVTPKRNQDEVTVDEAFFKWRLLRDETPHAPGLRPIYTYRLWRSSVPGKTGYNADYEPVPGETWTDWSMATEINLNYLIGLEPELEDRYVLLVVAGADEAGNVTPFPPSLALDVPAPQWVRVVGPSSSGPNWQRFFVPGRTDQMKTHVRAVFWHERLPADYRYTVEDGEWLGETREPVIPPPESGMVLMGQFRVTPEAPRRLRGATLFDWRVGRPDLGQWSPNVNLDPYDPLKNPVVVEFPWNPLPEDPVHCVFQARTVADLSVPPDGDYEKDTPAEFWFWATPSRMGRLTPKGGATHQPIVIHQHREQ